MKNISVTLLFIIFIFFSCGKEESLTKTELLTKAPWILTSKIYSPPFPASFGSIVDEYSILPDYYRDDLYYYYPSGTYANMEGSSKYSPLSPDVWEVGVWTFNEDETKLYKGIIDYLNELEVLKLDGSALQTRSYILDSLESIHTVTETYKHP